jgi:hypothetical protein
VKANKGGRPPTGRPTGRKVTVYLLPDVECKAREIGAGNLSGGVAQAVRKYPARLDEAEVIIRELMVECGKNFTDSDTRRRHAAARRWISATDSGSMRTGSKK